jgi:hypothetical protein
MSKDVKKTSYKNRYGDIFTFTLQEDGDVLWEGDFQYCRFGMPNDYTKAYKEYINDNRNSEHRMSFDTFKQAVHEWDDETSLHVYDKYVRMVESVKDKINMVDPSGGCYISSGMDLDFLGFKGLVVKEFEVHEKGYLIVTEK